MAGSEELPAADLRVLALVQSVLADLDPDLVLRRVLDAARELSGAQYAALGVLNGTGEELGRFITSGIDESARREIGALPRGRGVLGVLIADPVPLRLTDVGGHPSSYGFPPGHPPMRTFLGVPLIVSGTPYGNLYVAEKAGGEPFSEADEHSLMLLAQFAEVAIDHSRRFGSVDAQRSELARTVQALDATVQIARAVGGETDLNVVLELVAKRGRALVSARALVIEHQHGSEMVVAAAAELPDGLVGQSVDLHGSLAASAIRTGRTLLIEDQPNKARFERHGLGGLGVRADAGLVVPLIFRGRCVGVLIATDRLTDGPSFTAEDQRLLQAFAASAATAIATASTVQAERRRQRMAAAEEERSRWARELHDETLQNLAALRLEIAAQALSGKVETMAQAMRDAVSQLDREIATLRSLITDLRPAALDELGTQAALEALAERARADGLDVTLAIDLSYERGRAPDRHSSELETALYRITQESLTNARKHGHATRATVRIVEDEQFVHITVRDDGVGFDTTYATAGFGQLGMRERAELLNGTLDITSAPGEGTEVRVVLPTGRMAPAARAS